MNDKEYLEFQVEMNKRIAAFDNKWIHVLFFLLFFQTVISLFVCYKFQKLEKEIVEKGLGEKVGPWYWGQIQFFETK